MSKPILIIAGTNRPASNAQRLARVVESLYRKAGISTDLLALTDVPAEMYDPSSYAAKPPSVQALQKRVLDAAGLHVIVPEYNGSYPGALKYFIDMLKFPESFDRKPVAYIGEAAGTWGGLRAVEQLQMVFGYRNAHSYPVRVFITAVHTKFDAAGNFADAELQTRLDDQCAGFSKFVASLKA
jgi:chromate reductase, NAD(P)H dehydrogenase (quinone)